jgi:hypothetical protein
MKTVIRLGRSETQKNNSELLVVPLNERATNWAD